MDWCALLYHSVHNFRDNSRTQFHVVIEEYSAYCMSGEFIRMRYRRKLNVAAYSRFTDIGYAHRFLMRNRLQIARL